MVVGHQQYTWSAGCQGPQHDGGGAAVLDMLQPIQHPQHLSPSFAMRLRQVQHLFDHMHMHAHLSAGAQAGEMPSIAGGRTAHPPTPDQ